MVRARAIGLFAESGTSWDEEHAGVRNACRVGPREFLKEYDLNRTAAKIPERPRRLENARTDPALSSVLAR